MTGGEKISAAPTPLVLQMCVVPIWDERDIQVAKQLPSPDPGHFCN
jgi:hypothetical protein